MTLHVLPVNPRFGAQDLFASADEGCADLLYIHMSTPQLNFFHQKTLHVLCAPRFGAQDLFASADEGCAERTRQLMEEDLDDILARAEVVTQQQQQQGGQGQQQGQGMAGGAADLLSSFNVATFKVGHATLLRWLSATAVCIVATGAYQPVSTSARGIVCM
jgi:hypothetical protein